ncbi:protein NipSnap [Drosophila innubila]|uniref:protein NipSnap n=1 Tax=Drosophila innubila TaxID=198719 RepID=UPI00148C61B0|nr:protein NipSnap [Drosophila innubila]
MLNLRNIWSLGNNTGLIAIRSLSTTASCRESDSWFSKLLVRKIEPTKESHSRMLSDKEIIYALHTHNVRPDSMGEYLNNYKNTVALIKEKKSGLSCNLVASWTVQVGDMDQCLHLWKYTGGFEKIDQAKEDLWNDPEYLKLMNQRSKFLRSRHLQYLLAFSYWPQIESRSGKNIYEMRSYRLTPGTMIEWGNNWARAINFRKHNNEAFAGFFSQIGRLYNVHHIWCYKSLQDRKETREAAWRSPGWDECVAYTVPLIREMHCRVLAPTEFSPSQ